MNDEFSHDELMQRLVAADPIDPDTLPSADATAANELMETIMKSDSANALGEGAQPEPRTLDLPNVPGVERYARSHRRSRSRTLLAGAAAAIVLIAGLLVFSPDNTAPALATVHSAAQTTAEADTGRVLTTFSVDGTDGAEAGQVAGSLEASFNGADVSLSVDIDEAVGSEELGALPASEARLIDGVLYVNAEPQWYAVETAGFLSQSLVDVVDPRSVLATVQDLVETDEVGTVDIDGVSTTHYRSVVDLGEEPLGQSGWMALQGADVEVDGEVTIDLYIDDDGQLRQLDVSGDLQEPEGGTGSANFVVSSSFFDLGSDITIDVPADVITVDPLDGFDFGN